MTARRQDLEVRTRWRTEAVEVTERVREALVASGLADGFVHCFVPHTTAAVTLNERLDPKVVADFVAHVERLAPWNGEWSHPGNAAAHVRAGLVGHSLTIPVEGGQLLLGEWQGVFLCEFHGPRARTLRLVFQAA